MDEIHCLWEIPAILGEGPVWDERTGSVYWVDIVEKKVYAYHLDRDEKQSWTFDTPVTSLFPRKQGGFVCTIRDGFAYFNPDEGRLTPLALPEAHLPGNRFNDGKVDAFGRYWAGSMDDFEKDETGALYRMDPDLSVHKMDAPYKITNGPAFSVDHKIMYHTDTGKRIIYAFDLAPSGDIRNKREFIRFEDPAVGYPDGMTVDAENALWVCHFGGFRITRYSPAGEILQVLKMPVPNITSCTFGGAGLDVLFITTARHLMSESRIEKYPLAGSLFSCKPGVRGLKTPWFETKE